MAAAGMPTEVSSRSSYGGAAGPEALVGGVAVAEGAAGVGLDQPVDPFRSGVRDAGRDRGEDLRPPGRHGRGQAFHLRQAARIVVILARGPSTRSSIVPQHE